MKSISFILTYVLMLFLVSFTALAQQPAYPIIFVHGLIGSEETFEYSYEYMNSAFQWGEVNILDITLNGDDIKETAYVGFERTSGQVLNDEIIVIGPRTANGGNVWHANSNIFAINFKAGNFPPGSNHQNDSFSDQAGFFKQGCAIRLMIDRVLNFTGAEKVILVGHSMGGLAIREYLQRKTIRNGNFEPHWWDPDVGHRVAKVVTTGTPHFGSNANFDPTAKTTTFIPNWDAEANRDLIYFYDRKSPAGNHYRGIYLFGGNELTIDDTPLNNTFHNVDINCNNSETDDIIGINKVIDPEDPEEITWADNPLMPLPVDVDYTWIVSDFSKGESFGDLLSPVCFEGNDDPGDGAVLKSRQYLTSVGDTIQVALNHFDFLSLYGCPKIKSEGGNYPSILRAVDEPDQINLAYGIKTNKPYHGFATYQTDRHFVDFDYYKFNIAASGLLRFKISDIPPNGNFTNMVVNLFESDQTTLIGSYSNTGGVDFIEFYRDDLANTEYFLEIKTILPASGSDSWKHPYTFGIYQIGPPFAVYSYSSPTSIPADGNSQTTITAQIQDVDGNLIGTSNVPVTFTILSGNESGELLGPATVNANNGIATIPMRSTLTPGQVQIEASSSGLQSHVFTVVTHTGNSNTLVSGNISTNTTWDLAGSPYEVTGDITVLEGVILTIEAGVIVKFRDDRDIYVRGGLNAQGTAFNPIIFTSVNAQLPGTWGGIKFQASTISAASALKYCQFTYAGNSGFGQVGYPILLNLRANPLIENTTIASSRINGIGLETGSYNADVRIDDTGLPLWMNGDITIEAGATLTIAPGVLFKMAPEADLQIHGGLLAQGTLNDRIVFTSYKDDARGGDTNNDGSSLPLPGDWGGIKLSGSALSSSLKLIHCDINYAGSTSFGENPFPVVLNLQANPVIENTVIEFCRINGIGLETGGYSTDVRIDNHNLPLWVGNDITMAPGATLTVAPGVIFKMASEADLQIEGGIIAEGTPTNRIIFTSYKDDARGGDTNNDGNSLPLPGDWGGIKLFGSALNGSLILRYCDINYAGSTSFGENSFPLVLSLQANPVIENTTTEFCRINGIGLMSGSYNTDVRIDNHQLPLWVGNDITIAESAIFTVAPGIIFKMAPDTDFQIRGGLKAIGNPGNPIIFTSYKDDARGGDTNNDGNSLPLPGDWGGIQFYDTAIDNACIIDYCVLDYAGSSSLGENSKPIICTSASPLIQNSKIEHSKSEGIYINGNSEPDLGGGNRGSVGRNQFLGFVDRPATVAIYNNSPNNIFAKYNYFETNLPAIVEENIYDFYDNAAKGIVFYDPFNQNGNFEPPAVTLISPNGGEVLLFGETHPVQWNATDPSGVYYIRLALSIDGGQTYSAIDSLSNSGIYQWHIPDITSYNCRLKVSAIDVDGNVGVDISDAAFAILSINPPNNLPPAKPEILAPANGIEIYSGTYLTWSESIDPNPFDVVSYQIQVDESIDFTSPEIDVTDRFETPLYANPINTLSESVKMKTGMDKPLSPAGNSVSAQIMNLSGYQQLQDNTIYYWRVRAMDNFLATSAYTDSTRNFFYNVQNDPPGPVIAGFSPADGDTTLTRLPEISWLPASDPDLSDHSGNLNYLLQLSETDDFSSINAEYLSGIGQNTVFVTDTLQSDQMWYYRIQTIDDDGATSSWSETQQFFIYRPMPPLAFNLLFPANNDTLDTTQVTFRWEATSDPNPDDSVFYRLQFSYSEPFDSAIAIQIDSLLTNAFTITLLPDTIISWRVEAYDAFGLRRTANQTDWKFRLYRQPMGIDDLILLPQQFQLDQNYPNPFNPTTTIRFGLPIAAQVRLVIYNLLGRRVATVLDARLSAGYHKVEFEGSQLASGLYLYSIQAGNFVKVRKMLLMK